MRNILMVTMVLGLMTGSVVNAGEGHAHKPKTKQSKANKDNKTCSDCGKKEKDCDCHGDEKHDDNHDHKNEKKDSK